MNGPDEPLVTPRAGHGRGGLSGGSSAVVAKLRVLKESFHCRHEGVPKMAVDRLVVLRAAAASGLWQCTHRFTLDESPESIADHAVRDTCPGGDLLSRRGAFSFECLHDLSGLLVAEQRGGSSACLSPSVH